jgi:hypothetical protein
LKFRQKQSLLKVKDPTSEANARLNLLATHIVIVESGVNLISPRRYYKKVVKSKINVVEKVVDSRGTVR